MLTISLIRRHTSWILITLGAIGLIIGIALLLNKPPIVKPTAVEVASMPSSVKPSSKAIANYSVPLTTPKYISIPTINVFQARIKQLGLLRNGQIATPNNIYDTGWYDASARPGQMGAMFIYGHVSSWTADGVFYNLKNLKAGDTINVMNGANKNYTYRVVSLKIYPYNNVDMQQVLAPIQASTPGLNLMTCTGNVIKGTSEFNERLVVFSSLINN
jgi:LPXTG-site transpeptidase (sortase) family protein